MAHQVGAEGISLVSVSSGEQFCHQRLGCKGVLARKAGEADGGQHPAWHTEESALDRSVCPVEFLGS